MAVSQAFQLCNVCRCNHNRGRKHIYAKKHISNVQNILHKYGKKVEEARRSINAPSVFDGELEPGAQFWCHFCGNNVKKHVTDKSISIQFGGVYEHIASEDHRKNTDCWFHENGAEKTNKTKFLLSKTDLQRFKNIVQDKLNDHENEVEKVYDMSVLLIKEKEKLQKEIAEQPPAPYFPPPTMHHTVRNNLGILQNPTGFHEGQRVWGGGIVKYKPESDQWYPWEFDLDDGRKNQGCMNNSHSSTISRNPNRNKDINEEDNVHTGATPPWLLPDDDGSESPAIGPSVTEFQRHVERSKKLGKNPNRVGANFDRKSEVSSEWLPSFGGVWNSGPRWQTRRNLKTKKDERNKR